MPPFFPKELSVPEGGTEVRLQLGHNRIPGLRIAAAQIGFAMVEVDGQTDNCSEFKKMGDHRTPLDLEITAVLNLLAAMFQSPYRHIA